MHADQEAELGSICRYVKSQHEGAVSLLALVALGLLEQSPDTAKIQCHCCSASYRCLLGQRDLLTADESPKLLAQTPARISYLRTRMGDA